MEQKGNGKATRGELEAPCGKQRGIFDPKGEKSICIRASNPRPKGREMRRAVRVQNGRIVIKV